VYENTLFFEGVQQQNPPKTPGNALSDALQTTRFQNFAVGAAKKKPRCARFFETAIRTVLIDRLIRCQRFCQVVCFTDGYPFFLSFFWSGNQMNLLVWNPNESVRTQAITVMDDH